MMRNTRAWIFSVCLVAVLVLPFSVRAAFMSWHAYGAAQQQWADARVQAKTLVDLRQKLEVFKSYKAEVQALMDHAEKMHFAPEDWETRHINVRLQELTRREVGNFLASAGRGSGYFFKPESFQLHTVQEGDDLFHYHKGDVDRLRMTLTGVYMARGGM